MSEKRDWVALLITVCAVITAMPRWIGALLASEGFTIPESWRPWWLIASVLFNAAMAITEGAAFAYVFNAWRNQRDKSADRLLWFAGISGVTFVIVLAPFIAAEVKSETLASTLSTSWALWLWSVAVAASTIVIVASVGYAQKRTSVSTASTKRAQSEAAAQPEPTQVAIEPAHSEPIAQLEPTQAIAEPAQELVTCPDCPREFATVQALSAHKRFCNGVHANGKAVTQDV